MIKYMIHPGEVQSKNDGDIHFISYERLIELYGVPRQECLNADRPEHHRGLRVNLIHLYPRRYGKYTMESESA